MLYPSVAGAAGVVNSATCGNEGNVGFGWSLPDCRAYELVTPVAKGGGVVNTTGAQVSINGQRLLSSSFKAFGGAEDDQVTSLIPPRYEFVRNSETGWATIPLSPPASLFPTAEFFAATADLDGSIWSAATLPGNIAEEDLYRSFGPTAPLTLIGPGEPPSSRGKSSNVLVVAGSQDLTHILVNITQPRTAEVALGHNRPWPGDTTVPNTHSLYEYTGVENAEPRLVGVSNNGVLAGSPYVNDGASLISQCGVVPGVQDVFTEHYDTYNALSDTGSIAFFTAIHGPCARSGGGSGYGPTADELYARLGGARTLALSEPPLSTPGRQCTNVCVEDENEENGHQRQEGDFAGASADGTKVFFTTAQPLVDEDEDEANDLYMEELGCPPGKAECSVSEYEITRIVQVSHDPHAAEAAEVQGVARVSEDGSRVYFVARGSLTEKPNTEGSVPTPGAYNLYVYEPYASHPGFSDIAFVGTLLRSDAEASMVEVQLASEVAELESECHGSLSCIQGIYGEYATVFEGIRDAWSPIDMRPVQASPDGRFLLFTSWQRLTADDTSTAPQLFEYDAQTGKLARVSVGQHGYNNNGNVSSFQEAPAIPAQAYRELDLPSTRASGLALSDDGKRVFFESRDSLTPTAVNGLNNVYEYEDGQVYLISGGVDASTLAGGSSPAVRLVGTDASGADVFFSTEEQLVPEDTDTQLDIYDARVEGGFPQPRSETCEGTECEVTSAGPPVFQAPSSAIVSPSDLTQSPSSSTVSPPRRLTRAQKLARALRRCHTKSRKRRGNCKVAARKRYGSEHKKRRDAGLRRHNLTTSAKGIR